MTTRKLIMLFSHRMLLGTEVRTIKVFTALLLALALLAGCSKDDITDGGDFTAVVFSAGIEAPTRTASGGDAWLATDQVGVFMLTTDGSLTTPVDVLADNKQYNVTTAGASSALTPDGGTPLYYPQSGAVDFVAYYPYGTVTADYKYSISLAGQTSADAQNTLDVLYTKKTGVSKTKTAVGLEFSHVLSKITLNVTLGDGLTSLTGTDITSVVFSGMPAGGTLELQGGTLTAGAAGDFPALKAGTPTSPAVATFTALLVPQPAGGAGRTAVFTVDGITYTWNIANGDAFAAGSHYTYPVTVKKTGITVGNPTITAWNTYDELNAGTARKIDVVKIPAGSFTMGSPASEPGRENVETQHEVTLTNGFFMSKYPVTVAQYVEFLNDIWLPCYAGTQRDGYTLSKDGIAYFRLVTQWNVVWNNDTQMWYPIGLGTVNDRSNYPMTGMYWGGAKAYADWIGGSLPTEAQWEYAARAGKATAYPFEAAQIDNYCWYAANSGDNLQPVGKKQPNPWGLYDMHGLVWEWCLDTWDGSDYSPATVTDPLSPNPHYDGNHELIYHVRRGGTYLSPAADCRSASRSSDYDKRTVVMPGLVFTPDHGFRVVFNIE